MSMLQKSEPQSEPQNVDPQEIAKFSTLAATWWDPAGALKTLHQLNPLRLGFIKQNVDLNQKQVIDIGCGGGILSESLAAAGATVTAIDMNPEVITAAKQHQRSTQSNVTYLQTDAASMAAATPHAYDVVTCFELLEHVPDPAAIIKASADLLKPGGHFFFSTLNRNPKSYLFAILGAEYLLKLLPKNTHDYAKFIRPSELSAWLRQVNLSLLDLTGVAYNPLQEKFKFTKDISVNYLGVAKKIS